MPRDYAKKSRPRRGHHRKKSSGWCWLCVGILVGLFAAGLVYLKTNDHSIHKAHLTKHKTIVIKKAEKLPPKPRFDFYTLLPKMKVWVPHSDTRPYNPKQQVGPKNKHAHKPTIYILQIASFKRYDAADKLRAELILQDYNVKISNVKNQGKTWHRVLVGPFKSEHKAERAQINLAKQHHKSLLLEYNPS